MNFEQHNLLLLLHSTLDQWEYFLLLQRDVIIFVHFIKNINHSLFYANSSMSLMTIVIGLLKLKFNGSVGRF